jgi:hypothetical protein
MEEIKRQSGVFFDDPEIEESPDELDSATDGEEHEIAEVAPLENGGVRRRVEREFDGAGSGADGDREGDEIIQRLGLDERAPAPARGRAGSLLD